MYTYATLMRLHIIIFTYVVKAYPQCLRVPNQPVRVISKAGWVARYPRYGKYRDRPERDSGFQFRLWLCVQISLSSFWFPLGSGLANPARKAVLLA
jgi:hypothetical protein